MSNLSIHLLGLPVFMIDQKPFKIKLSRATAILIYCICRGGPQGRDHISNLFWPESRNASKHLNDALHYLKRSLKEAGATEELLSGWESTWEYINLHFNGNYYCDIEEFEKFNKTEVIARADLKELERVVNLYRGEFLGNFKVKHCNEAFDTWVSTKRSWLEGCHYELLCNLSLRYMAAGQCKAAIPYLEELRAKEPEAEELYGLLMISYAAIGQAWLAQEVYQQYEEMMRDSFPMPPDISMTNLYHLIRKGQLSNQQIEELVSVAIQDNQNLQIKKIFFKLQDQLEVREPLRKSPAYLHLLHQAEVKAASKGFNFVGTPHLFLAFCMREHFLPQVHKDTGVDFELLAKEMDYILGVGPNKALFSGNYTLELRDVLQTAGELAREAKAISIESLHLWLALLKVEQSLLAQLLERHDHDRIQLQKRVEQIIYKTSRGKGQGDVRI